VRLRDSHGRFLAADPGKADREAAKKKPADRKKKTVDRFKVQAGVGQYVARVGPLGVPAVMDRIPEPPQPVPLEVAIRNLYGDIQWNFGLPAGNVYFGIGGIGFDPHGTIPGDMGRDLLLACLTPGQKHQFETEEQFAVKGSDGGQYMIRCKSRNTTWNVSDGKYEMCAYLPGVTCHDSWLAQKLALETDEKKFRLVAYARDGMMNYLMSGKVK
jgi:hypothetical protein